MTDWQPIETAPRDGRKILAVRRGYVELASWDADLYAQKPRPFWRCSGPWGVTDMRAIPPTHWMPIPPLPRAGKLRDQQEAGAEDCPQDGLCLFGSDDRGQGDTAHAFAGGAQASGVAPYGVGAGLS